MAEFHKQEPSPVKNITGGAGCGCGCLGVLAMLLGGVVLAGVPLRFYDGADTIPQVLGTATLVGGGLAVILGIVVWLASLLLE